MNTDKTVSPVGQVGEGGGRWGRVWARVGETARVAHIVECSYAGDGSSLPPSPWASVDVPWV